MGTNRQTNVNILKINEPQYEYQLREVYDDVLVFDSRTHCDKFLGIEKGILSAYVKSKTKIIKSKIDGKTYLIRRIIIK